MMKNLMIGAALCAILAACNTPQAQTEAGLQVPNLAVPAGGITPVKDVIVTPRENDTVEFTAAANGTFKIEQVTAVMWCRAAQYAKANKIPDWRPLKTEPLRPATADAPMIARGLVQMVKNPAPGAGRQTKDWCREAPRAAQS
jgi:Zn finger protein HypA/HybF involved in hydrogenase expression